MAYIDRDISLKVENILHMYATNKFFTCLTFCVASFYQITANAVIMRS